MMDFINKNRTQAFWILVVIIGCGAVALLAVIFDAEPTKVDSTNKAKLVRTMKAEKVDRRIAVSAQGTVQADKEVELKSEVSGRVIARSSELVEGGLVDGGEILVQIDPRDFENQVEQEKAALEKTNFELQIEKGRQLIAKREWEKLSPTIQITEFSEELALRKPHLREKEAQVEAAKSRLEKAKLDLSRTIIQAPFDAVVVETKLQVGDYLTPQSSFATLAGTDMFRVQVSIPVSKLRWLIAPGKEAGIGAKVKVIQEFDGSQVVREGHVLRLLGDLDPNGRMARILVGVDDPLGIKHDHSFPMLIGSYVKVEFEGPVIEEVIVLPRKVLREDNRVWVMNSDQQLEVREVNVIQKDDDYVYIDSGLDDHSDVVVSPLGIPIEGMLLEKLDETENQDG